MWQTILVAIVVAAAASYIAYCVWKGASRGGGGCDGACENCPEALRDGGTPICPSEPDREVEEP